MRGHSQHFTAMLLNFKPATVSASTLTEYVLPVIYVNSEKAVGNSALPKTAFSYCQTSHQVARGNVIPAYPRFAQARVTHTDKSTLIDLSVITAPDRNIDLRTGALGMMATANFSKSGLSKFVVNANAISRTNDVGAAVNVFVDKCMEFYNYNVPMNARQAETASFVANGGVQPVMKESLLNPESCGMFALLVNDKSDFHGLGGDAPCVQVRSPADR